MAGAPGKSAVPRPLGAWKTVAIATAVVLAVLAGFFGGTLYEAARLPPMIAVTPVPAVETRQSPANYSLTTDCNGASQWSWDGFWECSFDLKNTGSLADSLGLLNVSAPLAVNLVVSPKIGFSVYPGTTTGFVVTGQLGYTGKVTVYLDLSGG